MDERWENWPLHTEIDRDGDFLEQCCTDDEEFFRDILQQPAFSSESESQSQRKSFHPSAVVQNNFTATVAGATTATDGSSLSSDEMATGFDRPGKRPCPSARSPRTYILSFDNSTIIPATPEPYLGYQQLDGQGTRSCKSNSPLSSKKRTLENRNFEPKPRASQGGKKSRNDTQILDHIMAERKRRQELTERFIALSAIIPGLKKTDKASILRDAINYVKQLQERVMALEMRNKRGTESMIFLKKTDICSNEDITTSETSSDADCCRPSKLFPDVEARVLEKDVLIEIHCEKENGIELKLLDQLENLHLSVTGSSVLPFGNSTLGITIVAQMGDAYSMTVNDLVKNLRQVLLNHKTCNTDPY